MSAISRRSLLEAGAVAGAAMAMPSIVRADWGEVRSPSRPKSFRVAHLTDMHVTPDKHAGEGYAAALRSLEAFKPRPDLVITGGDHVMDSWATETGPVYVQWDLYQRVLKDNCGIPVRPTIGNHDVFGCGLPDKVSPETAGYGKAMYLDRMGLTKSYYSFDAGGWHFICLDNITRRPDKPTSYMAMLDEEQQAWLRGDLDKAAATRAPICVVTHIPLLCVCAFFDENFPKDSHDFPVNDSLMQHDPKPLLTLLRKYNVKLCLSGHIHLVDRIEYLGITFICDGAVSGNWWKGPRQEFPEGYGVIDFYPDGTFEHQFHTYGWVAKA